jgi:hypothetical protein
MGTATTPDRAHTRAMRAPLQLTAVFVDPSGRRSKRLRRMAVAVAVLALALVALLWVSQYGGPVGPTR